MLLTSVRGASRLRDTELGRGHRRTDLKQAYVFCKTEIGTSACEKVRQGKAWREILPGQGRKVAKITSWN